MQAVEEPLGALARLDGEVGPRDASPTNSESPVSTSRSSGEEAAVLRPVAGRVEARGRATAPTATSSPSASGLVRVLGLRRRVHANRQAVLEREPAVAGDVVGVRVRLEHADDPDAVPLGLVEVLLDRVGRVDEERLARLLVSDEVGGAAEIVVDELAEEHVRR